MIVCCLLSVLVLQQEPPAAAVNVRGPDHPFLRKWMMNDTTALLIEKEAFSELQAPLGIAPRTKRPLSTPSEMTAHHWLNFAKVYGKYLFAQIYKGHHLRVLCDLLDYITRCLSSSLTPDLLKEIKRRSIDMAKDIDRYFPASEKTLVLHLLIFHIPSTLSYWGPARGYWCFPFER
jgi:hypothetical protein